MEKVKSFARTHKIAFIAITLFALLFLCCSCSVLTSVISQGSSEEIKEQFEKGKERANDEKSKSNSVEVYELKEGKSFFTETGWRIYVSTNEEFLKNRCITNECVNERNKLIAEQQKVSLESVHKTQSFPKDIWLEDKHILNFSEYMNELMVKAKDAYIQASNCIEKAQNQNEIKLCNVDSDKKDKENESTLLAKYSQKNNISVAELYSVSVVGKSAIQNQITKLKEEGLTPEQISSNKNTLKQQWGLNYEIE